MTIIILGMTSGAFINYTLNYLELEPQYLCQYGGDASPWVSNCTQGMVCKPASYGIKSFKVDYSTNKSIKNWVE